MPQESQGFTVAIGFRVAPDDVSLMRHPATARIGVRHTHA